MPKPHPKDFRDDVVAVARKGQAPLTQIARDFGISNSCLRNWLRAAYAELLIQLRLIAGGSMRQVWLEEPTSADEGMNFPLGRLDLSAFGPHEERYLQAVRKHLDLWHRDS